MSELAAAGPHAPVLGPCRDNRRDSRGGFSVYLSGTDLKHVLTPSVMSSSWPMDSGRMSHVSTPRPRPLSTFFSQSFMTFTSAPNSVRCLPARIAATGAHSSDVRREQSLP